MDLYGDRFSGNCYKIQLVLHLLGEPYRWHDIDILAGESRTAEFLAMNPNGRVPLLRLADGRCLAESNAIAYYLAERSPYVPDSRFDRSVMLGWQNFEQYNHEPNIATSRYIRRYLGNPPELQDELARRQQPGYAALAVMDAHLASHDFFAAKRYTIADISLYAYTHVADEGGFDLHPYPNIRAWLSRVAEQPGHITMASAEAVKEA